MTTNPLHNATDGPTVICGIVIYGIEYINEKLADLVNWKRMNPGVTFVIMTIRLRKECKTLFKANIAHLKGLKDVKGNVVFGTNNDDGVIDVDIDVDYSTIPFINWLRKYTYIYRLPVHFISDILRWYCLDILVKKKTADYICVMEADLICLKNNWIIDYINSQSPITNSPITNSPIKDTVSIFGTDRTFIMYNGNTEILKNIIISFNDIYKYFIETNLYRTNNLIYFIKQIKNGEIKNGEIKNGNESDKRYKSRYDDALIQLKKELNSKVKVLKIERIEFITNIPLSTQMGINIRHSPKYLFNLTLFNDDPQFKLEYYTHANLGIWNTKIDPDLTDANDESDEETQCTPVQTSPTKKRKPNPNTTSGGKKTKKNKRKTLKYKRKTLKRG